MDAAYILVTAFLVGLSGAMAPGPLTAVTAEHSLKKGFKAGPLVTFGHGIMEALVVLLLAAGLGSYMASDLAGGVIGLVGGTVLFLMGYKMFSDARSGSISIDDASLDDNQIANYDNIYTDTQDNPDNKNNIDDLGDELVNGTVVAGIIATVSNPYWFIWWATVGAGYITISLQYGTRGLLFFFVGHMMADFLWLSFISLILASGKKFITDGIYRGVMASLSIFIIGMGGYFVWSGINFLQGG
ncbi:LysE family transporter [Natranaerofaba carboxydovora]|uniref:LysE family transporter n=1 Tax=Natranaerofaba carboxydovora TaxID=2742683 RepID=UPI001F13D46E|nr:LysE family transporter [Natranaerofaba carboxydovora]